MPFLPDIIISLLALLAPCFTKPTWEHAQVLLIGAILCPAKRTVTACLQIMGLSNEKNFDKYHRVLSQAKFDDFSLVKILLGLLVLMIPSGFPIIIAMDETIERRKGTNIKAKGCYRDACRSTHSLVIKCFGLKWQCATLLVKLPWNKRTWALPFMTVLCHPKKYADAIVGYKVKIMISIKAILINQIGYYNSKTYYVNTKGVTTLFPDHLNQQLMKYINGSEAINKIIKRIKRNIDNLSNKNMKLFTALCGQTRLKHRTSVDYAMIMMKKISGILKKKSWIFVGDGGFSCVKLGLACKRNNVTLISRLLLSASLYEELPIQTEVKKGRKRLKGNKVQALHEFAKNTDLVWNTHEISWYNNTIKQVELVTGVNLWYTPRFKPLLIRWVLVRDINSGKVQAFFSTDTTLLATTIIEYFVLRWNIEVTFEEVRAHLGVETQRQWSDKAINRSTPMLMGLFSLVCIMAYRLTDGKSVPAISTAWYEKKDQATFSDVLIYVKNAIARKTQLNKVIITDNFVQISRKDYDEIMSLGLLAA